MAHERRFFKNRSCPPANAPRLANATLLSLFFVRQLGEGKIDVNDAERLPNSADLPFLQAAYPLANWSARAAIAAALVLSSCSALLPAAKALDNIGFE